MPHSFTFYNTDLSFQPEAAFNSMTLTWARPRLRTVAPYMRFNALSNEPQKVYKIDSIIKLVSKTNVF